MIPAGLVLVLLYLFPDAHLMFLILGVWLMCMGIGRQYILWAKRRQVRHG